MKNLILIFAIVLTFSMQAQFTLTKVGTSTQILNNDVFTYSTYGDAAAELKFKINNNNAFPINMKIRCMSITNADGTAMQFCFGGTCISAVNANTNYPTDAPFYSEIPAMSNNGNFDHFKNMEIGTGTIQDYVFKFFQVDNSGVEIGTPITITYRYQPVLSTSSFTLENLGILLKSTLVDNQIEIASTTENTTMEMIDLNGHLIKSMLLTNNNIIDISNFTSGMYLIKFIDNSGKTATAKILKK